MTRQEWLARAEELETWYQQLVNKDDIGSYSEYLRESARIARSLACDAPDVEDMTP